MLFNKNPSVMNTNVEFDITSVKSSKIKAFTNIRVPTGVANFDNLIQGGFKKNSVNLIVGGPGAGKSIFATQFLIAGMDDGEKCLYITFEENKEQFYDNMLAFGWDLKIYEKKGLFTFLRYSPTKIKSLLDQGGGFVESNIVGKKITRVVIDSITSFGLIFASEFQKREAGLCLFNQIKKWNCTSLLTLECDPSKNSECSETFEFLSDSVTKFYFMLNNSKRERFLEVFKMRGVAHSNELFNFEVNENGIGVENKASIKNQLI